MKVINDAFLLNECGDLRSCAESYTTMPKVVGDYKASSAQAQIANNYLKKVCRSNCIKFESMPNFINITSKEQFINIRETEFRGMWAFTEDEITLQSEYDFLNNYNMQTRDFGGPVYFKKINCYLYCLLNCGKIAIYSDLEASGSYWSEPYAYSYKFKNIFYYNSFFNTATERAVLSQGIISKSTIKHIVSNIPYYSGGTHTKPFMPGDYYVFFTRGRLSGAIKNSSNSIFYILYLGS